MFNNNGSIGNAVDSCHAAQELVFPLHVHTPVHFWIPVGQSTHVQPVAAASHQCDVDDVIEILVGSYQFVHYLRITPKIPIC